MKWHRNGKQTTDKISHLSNIANEVFFIHTHTHKFLYSFSSRHADTFLFSIVLCSGWIQFCCHLLWVCVEIYAFPLLIWCSHFYPLFVHPIILYDDSFSYTLCISFILFDIEKHEVRIRYSRFLVQALERTIEYDEKWREIKKRTEKAV